MEPNKLGISRLTAQRRLHTIESSLARDPDLKVKYHKFMKEYEDLGHMEPVNFQRGEKEMLQSTTYPVFKETSSTKKKTPGLYLIAAPSLPMALNNTTYTSPTHGKTLPFY